ncbi:UNKNOWN [Stylonychia lemnae]|uniref:Protein kinase domain-containing protein n=1 Tax=Stylonychia lemnae TaxID=5949 RepID=A0A077ZUN4_STYLE|nr:UNKNOWN [Stylonychia lemnae]|eukprot:CDW73015.1 UNKNOWN [Stylonychia lemnae]
MELDTIQLFNPKQFNTLRKLGQGSQASVFKVQPIEISSNIHKQKYALKIIKKGIEKDVQAECLSNEIKIMKSLKSLPNVVQLRQIFEDNENVYLLMDYKKGGNLKELIKNKGMMNEYEAKQVCFQLLQTLGDIHDKNVVHRDVTPQNILFEEKFNPDFRFDYKLSIADFGLSAYLDQIQNQQQIIKCGTPGFMAPEILRSTKYSSKSDIFSVGCVIYKMLTGSNLFDGINPIQILKLNWKCNVKDPIKNNLSRYTDACKEFMLQILRDDETRRPNAREAMMHPWIRPMYLKKDRTFKYQQQRKGLLYNQLGVVSGISTYQGTLKNLIINQQVCSIVQSNAEVKNIDDEQKQQECDNTIKQPLRSQNQGITIPLNKAQECIENETFQQNQKLVRQKQSSSSFRIKRRCDVLKTSDQEKLENSNHTPERMLNIKDSDCAS